MDYYQYSLMALSYVILNPFDILSTCSAKQILLNNNSNSFKEFSDDTLYQKLSEKMNLSKSDIIGMIDFIKQSQNIDQSLSLGQILKNYKEVVHSALITLYPENKAQIMDESINLNL